MHAIRNQKNKLERQIDDAYRKYEMAVDKYQNTEDGDYFYVYECREKYEHLNSHVKHQIIQCEGIAFNIVSRSSTMFNEMQERIIRLEEQFRTIVEKGITFLTVAEEHIRNYQDTGNINS